MWPRSILARSATAAAVTALAVPAGAHAFHARAVERQARQQLATALASVEPVVAAGEGTQRLTLNGAPVVFRRATEARPLDEVMASVASECASRDAKVALLDESAVGEGAEQPLELEEVLTQEAPDGVRASLCIFAGDPARGAEPMARRVRYTLARRVDASTTSVTTVVNMSSVAIDALFPTEGDAPGSDLPGVARPAEARRTLTAITPGAHRSVRVYESSLPVASAVASYDAAMAALGFARSAATETARMYRRGDTGASFVASFSEAEAGSRVAIAPFHPGRR